MQSVENDTKIDVSCNFRAFKAWQLAHEESENIALNVTSEKDMFLQFSIF